MSNTVSEIVLISSSIFSNLYSLPDDGRRAFLAKRIPDKHQKLIMMIRAFIMSNTVSETVLINSNIFSNLYSLPDDERRAFLKRSPDEYQRLVMISSIYFVQYSAQYIYAQYIVQCSIYIYIWFQPGADWQFFSGVALWL